MQHLATVVDLVTRSADRYDERIARVESVDRELRATARTLSQAMMQLQLARLAPVPVLLLVAVLSGLAGGAAVAACRPPPPAAAR